MKRAVREADEWAEREAELARRAAYEAEVAELQAAIEADRAPMIYR
jgi:hypothetical protein